MRSEYYRDFYGCHASIKSSAGRYRLKVVTPNGTIVFHNKLYDTYRGARIALGRICEGTQKLVGKEEA